MKHIYLVGIKGVGMTALAVYLKEQGYIVSGSDVPEVFPTNAVLSENNIAIVEGFKIENITDAIDLVVTTGAHNGLQNIEVVVAQKKGIPVKTLAQFVGEETNRFKIVISVCGSHGKTTTSAMVGFVLHSLGLSSSHLVGTPTFSGLYGGHYGGYDYLVVEADEYIASPGVDSTPRFMYQNPDVIICTSVEHDHPDAFPTPKDLEKAYLKFFQKLDNKKGVLIYCNEDWALQQLIEQVDIEKKIAYTEERMTLSIPGRHNRLNASAVLQLGKALNLDEDAVRNALESYTGSARRFEKIFEGNEIMLIDDYAHHPTEIEATIEAARAQYPGRRLVVVFQSHTYSRTKQFFVEFISSLALADRVYITDIFASARETAQQVTAQDMVAAAQKRGISVLSYCPFDQISTILGQQLQRGDVIITMGAGALYQVHDELTEYIKNQKK